MPISHHLAFWRTMISSSSKNMTGGTGASSKKMWPSPWPTM